MSLKFFHLFFITLSFVLMVGFGFWAMDFYRAQEQLKDLLLSGGAFFSAVVLLVYGQRIYRQFQALEKVHA